jgi:dihydrolipoamide dehydrogenase
MNMNDRFDVAVIGAGPGGFRVARRCAQKGASVAVVEEDFVGGTCLNYGCIPSKALLASAQVLLTAKNAAEVGVNVSSVTPNWQKIQQRKDAIVAGFRKSMTGTAQAHKLKMFQRHGTVVSPKKIKVQADGQKIEIEADKIVIASGSKPIEIPNLSFDGKTIISSKEALSLQGVPESMLIIGGGVIGCEMACVYAAMGTKVTIVEALDRLLPREDDWVGRLIEREFRKLDIDAVTGQKVISVDKTKSLAKVTLENGQSIESEKVLVSVGREPLTDRETVESLNLKMNGRAIAVNERFETNVPGVYALGDVIGTTYLAHGAFAEAEVAAVNITGGDEKMFDYNLIPRVTFTFPEVASVGKTEEICKSEGLDVTVGKGFFKANGRSVAHNQTAGHVRVIRDNSTNKILGITMVGDMVTEFIALARALIGTSEDISKITFPHPTVSETIEDAIEDALEPTLHNL